MKKPLRIIGAVIVLFILGSATAGAIIDKYNADSASRIGGSIDTFEGTVTYIVHFEGACLAYLIDKKYQVKVECPKEVGTAFVGNYDKKIVVGDKVKVKAYYEVGSADGGKFYNLEKPNTYMLLAQ